MVTTCRGSVRGHHPSGLHETVTGASDSWRSVALNPGPPVLGGWSSRCLHKTVLGLKCCSLLAAELMGCPETPWLAPPALQNAGNLRMAVDYHEPSAVGAKPGVMAHVVARFDHDSWFQCAIMRATTPASPTNAARNALKRRAAAANYCPDAVLGRKPRTITTSTSVGQGSGRSGALRSPRLAPAAPRRGARTPATHGPGSQLAVNGPIRRPATTAEQVAFSGWATFAVAFTVL